MSAAIKKFLDTEGLSYFWDKIKDYVGEAIESGTSDIANKIHFVVPNEKEATESLTATVSGVDSLAPGLVIALRMPFDSVAEQALNINNLGAKPLYYKSTRVDAGVFPAGTITLLIYETTTIATGCFKAVYSYDANIGISLEHVAAATSTTSMPYNEENSEIGGEFKIGAKIAVDGTYVVGGEYLIEQRQDAPIESVTANCSSLTITSDSEFYIELQSYLPNADDFWLIYKLEATLDDLLAAGENGLSMTEDTRETSVNPNYGCRPLPEGKTLYISCTDEGNGHYSFHPFIVESETAQAQDNLVVAQPDGTTTRVDMKPLLNQISIKKEVEYSTNEPTSQSTIELDNESFIFYETEAINNSSVNWDASITGNAATADSVNHAFTLKVDNGNAEGINKYTFNGSSAQEVNLTSGTGISLSTTYGTVTVSGNVYQGSTTAASGVAGLVPAATSEDKDKFLKGDGTWAEIEEVDAETIHLDGYQKADSASSIESSDSLLEAIGKLEKSLDGKQESGSYANSTHSHVGTEVTLAGYTKANSASVVSASDTINEAIGKLEKSLDGKQSTLSAVTSSELSTGTDTSVKGVTAKVLHDYVADEVSSGVAGLVNSAPAALDTLSELATALGNDANFATTVATSMGTKLDASSANYIKSLSIEGQTITYTKGDNTTGTLVTPDIPTAVSSVSFTKRASILTGFMLLDNNSFAVAYPNTSADYGTTIQYSYSWGMRFKEYEVSFANPTVQLYSGASMPNEFQLIFAFIIDPEGADDVAKYASCISEMEEVSVVDAAIQANGKYTTNVSFRGAGLYDWAEGYIEITKPESNYVITITYQFADKIQNVLDQTTTFTDNTSTESELVLTNIIPAQHTHSASEISGNYQGATSSSNGVAGLVPGAPSGDQEKFLKGDGTWDNEVLVLSSDPTTLNAKTFNVVVTNESVATGAIPVTTTGNQTVGGQKTFTAGIYGGSITLASNVSTFDVSKAVCFTKTITENTTLSFANVPADCVCCVSVILVNGGNYAVTWPAGVKWTDNIMPTLTKNGTDVLTFITCTGGSVWYGATACTGVTA